MQLTGHRQYYVFPFIVAIVLHLAIVCCVLYAFNFSTDIPLTSPAKKIATVDVVQAVSVDQVAVEKEIAKIQQQKKQEQTSRDRQQKHLIEQQRALKQQRARAAKTLAALHSERQLQEKSSAALKQQRLLLARQQAEQDLQHKLATAEQQRQKTEENKRLAGVVVQYKQLILNKIYPNWLVSGHESLSTELLINLSSTGTVLNISVQKSSGQAAFDRSAVAAVYKSSPLPVPKNMSALALFKTFRLTLQPQKIS